ncbi:aldehyde dehydrogenase family protein [Acinetobacter sp. B10A]|uniref:aldehyde dehydrogenase family protein n=1 Tax=Acinetobacter baretiae TaxID=2605383 RepID=UPI001B3C9AC8|nr:aldehyde dehydrogenase family protein [Acinetobacter baretiae]MBF7685569.1 aldehyde dehydrogenase family protein [Acinetobacter baretiae]
MSLLIDYSKQFINGSWVQGSSEKKIKNTNPYNGEELSVIQAADKNDVDQAYITASTSFQQWSKTPAEERKQLIQRIGEVIKTHREELVEWLIKESGSTHTKANFEIDASLTMVMASMDYTSEVNKATALKSLREDKKSQFFRKPLGVITVISPWNFPFHLSMRSVLPAIALGNTVVLKPASDTPVTGGLILARILELAKAPQGLLNVVVGSGSEIGDYVVEHDLSKFVSFTGSTGIGKQVAKLAVSSNRIKRVGLELGGNAPLVILDDAPLDLAVALTINGRFLHQGQICMSTNRVIVDAKIYDQFIEKLIPAVKNIKSGDPSLKDTLVGPIINQSQIDSIKGIIAKGLEQGAELLVKGEISGNLITPHVFGNVQPDMSLAKEESFGPVLPIIKARDEAHALELANDTEYGLSSAVCSADVERGLKFAIGIEAGMTHINDISVGESPFAPFGGEKNSGLGRFNSEWIIEEFTATHWITTPTQ